MADNYTLVTFLVVMMSLNVGLALYDGAIKSYNPDFDNKDFTFNFSSTPASKFTSASDLDSGVISNDTSGVFFDTADGVSPEGDTSFTDNWKTTNKFLLILETGASLVSSVLVQPAGFMISSGIPVVYAVSFQVIWYIIILLLLLGFRRGGR